MEFTKNKNYKSVNSTTFIKIKTIKQNKIILPKV